ncbi:hypothetical protein DFH06DRAFT_1397449 [Mycena polygramma]|nr:hypothetical protein DFH06DRAFT_1397449 [Mycena polygramma]
MRLLLWILAAWPLTLFTLWFINTPDLRDNRAPQAHAAPRDTNQRTQSLLATYLGHQDLVQTLQRTSTHSGPTSPMTANNLRRRLATPARQWTHHNHWSPSTSPTGKAADETARPSGPSPTLASQALPPIPKTWPPSRTTPARGFTPTRSFTRNPPDTARVGPFRGDISCATPSALAALFPLRNSSVHAPHSSSHILPNPPRPMLLRLFRSSRLIPTHDTAAGRTRDSGQEPARAGLFPSAAPPFVYY